MMVEKITDLNKVRQEKRQKSGWSIEEIRACAAQEHAMYKGLGQSEPDELASGGDMKKILEDAEDK